MDKQPVKKSSSFLTTTWANMGFVLELLLLAAQSKGDSQTVHQFLQDNLDKLDKNFLGFWKRHVIRIIKKVASIENEQEASQAQKLFKLSASVSGILKKIAQSEDRITLETLLVVSNLIRDFPLGDREINIEIAIFTYRKLFKTYRLPSSIFEFIMRVSELKLERDPGKEAKDFERLSQSLKSSKEHFKMYRSKLAEVQINLGIAYSIRFRGNPSKNLEKAISYLKTARECFTFDDFPEQWASVQMNLGKIYPKRLIGDRSKNLKQAVDCLKQAIYVYNRDSFKEQWIDIQSSLGDAYLEYFPSSKATEEEENTKFIVKQWYENNPWLADTDIEKILPEAIEEIELNPSDRSQNLETAIICFQNVLKFWTCERFPFEWADVNCKLGTAYYQRIQGDRTESLEQAIACFKNATQVYTVDAFPEQWAAIQDFLGMIYYEHIAGDKSDNLEQAIECFQRALQIRDRNTFPIERAVTQNHLGIAYSLRIQGENKNNLNQAIHCFQKALDVSEFKKALPQAWATTKNSLELVSQKAINPETSKVLALRKDISDAESLVLSQTENSKQTITDKKNTDSSLISNVIKSTKIVPLFSMIIFLNFMLIIFFRRSRFFAAIQIAKLCLKNSQVLKDLNRELGDLFVAQCFNNLAFFHMKIGNYSDSLEFLLLSQNIITKNWATQDLWNLKNLDNLANILSKIGGYGIALKCSQQVVNIVLQHGGLEHPYYAHSLNSLACRYVEMGDYNEALNLYQQVQEIGQKNWGEDHVDYAMVLQNMAFLYDKRDDYDIALSLYQQALETLRKKLGARHPRYAHVLHNLSCLYLNAGKHDSALLASQQVRDVLRKTQGEHCIEYTECLFRLALASIATNQIAAALPLMEQAVSIYEQLTKQLLTFGYEEQRLFKVQAFKRCMDVFLALVVQDFSTSQATLQNAFNLILRNKAMSAEASVVQRETVLRGLYPDLEPMLQKISQLQLQIAQRTLAGVESAVQQQSLLKLQAQRSVLESRLAGKVPAMALDRQLRSADSRTVAVKLSASIEGSALVEFFHLDVVDLDAVAATYIPLAARSRYLVFVLLPEEPDNVRTIDLGEAEAIDRTIAIFRTAITGKAEGRSFGTASMLGMPSTANAGLELRRKVFDPIAAVIGDRKRLFLSPDGDLTRLPFEVLPTDNGSYLIDDYRISYLSTGRDILRFGAESNRPPAEPLVIADPDFDLSQDAVSASSLEPAIPSGRQSRDLDRNSLHFGRLLGTKQEGEEIAAKLGVRPWLGDEALEARLKTCRSPRILHLATHGFFLKNQERDPNLERPGFGIVGNRGRLSGAGLENPLLRSGLALAGANTWLKHGALPDDAEDGILTAEDVSGLDLLDTDLVVLSACETGLGDVQTGEGVFGLRRAFALAGAKTLVMSLWKVPDQATQTLMTDFYDRILAGQPCADALREAQLALKQQYPQQPFYWGAFICQGDPARLPPSGVGSEASECSVQGGAEEQIEK